MGDEIISVNSTDCTRMSRIEAWNFMKKLNDGTATLVVRQKLTEENKPKGGLTANASEEKPASPSKVAENNSAAKVDKIIEETKQI